MNISDPISDMLTRLRNANLAGREAVSMPHSQLRSDIARVLKKEGYIGDFKLQKEGKKTHLQITLKGSRKSGAVVGMKKVSTPGRRRYVGARDIPRILGGMGICILSTSSGVMTGQDAKKKNVGGEILCEVW